MNETGVEITAGLGGFLVVFALFVALFLLGRDLTRRLRRMRLREEERVAGLRRDGDRPGAGDRSGADS
jgi:hypothetical protein